MSKTEAKMKATLELAKAVSYIEDLAASLKSGKLCITNCEKSLNLSPEAMIRLELEAGQKDDREFVSLKLTWRRGPVADERIDLHISADEEDAPAGK